MNIHDSGYKILFSNRTIFRQLIQTFVEEEWVQRLDFDQAIRLDKSFVSREDRALLEREIRSKKELQTMLVDALKKEDEKKRQLWVSEGIEQGIEQGIERGIEIGEAKGRAGRDRQIAQAMAARNYSVPTIAQLLAISEEDVLHLLAEEENGNLPT
jgi:flagellar biosynthesis/type III secretory pathway protein FliH